MAQRNETPIQCPHCQNKDADLIEPNSIRGSNVPGSYFCYVCGKDFTVERVKE